MSGGTRNEYRIYCNGALEGKQLLFQPDDILIFRAKKTSSLPKDILGSNDVPEAAVEEANVFFLYRCCDKNSELYRMCKKLVDESNIRGNGHAIYQGIITEVENKINQLCVKNFNEMDTVIEDTVTAKAQSGDIDEMASLFNSVSFRDFVMTGYKQKCAITGNVIQYKSFMNLEAAHIWPRSHKGLYLPSNGIALCRDMHWAFDKGMFTIGDDFKVIVHPDVESDYLQQYNNKSLYIPENAFFRPDINNLHYHQTHIYGLFKTSGSLVKATGFPIFINYDKQDNISDTTKYEDHFVAENRLIAISKSGRSMDSEDVRNFLKATERGIDVQLFVRKNKDDKISKEFYYLGRVIATGNAKQFVMPNTDKTAVKIEWELETPVREDIYQYIVNE